MLLLPVLCDTVCLIWFVVFEPKWNSQDINPEQESTVAQEPLGGTACRKHSMKRTCGKTYSNLFVSLSTLWMVHVLGSPRDFYQGYPIKIYSRASQVCLIGISYGFPKASI